MTALRYSYRIYPTAPQRQMPARTFGCVRTVYNDAPAIFQDAWRAGRVRPSMGAVAKQVTTEAKRTPERAWLGEVSVVPLQQGLRDLTGMRTLRSISGAKDGASWPRDYRTRKMPVDRRSDLGIQAQRDEAGTRP